MQNLPAAPESQARARSTPVSLDPDAWVVIGSGPAGVACARAVLDRGRKVHMLDSGLALESERHQLVKQLKANRPEAWNASDVAAFKAGVDAGTGGLPNKLVYGSD